MKLIAAFFGAVLLATPTASRANTARTIEMSEFGEVELQSPIGSAMGFIVAFSGAGGIVESDRIAIRKLTDAGFAVAVIDTGVALRDLDQPHPSRSCVDLSGPLEWLSANVEHSLGWQQYRAPLLFGQGAGGRLAYVALVQSSPRTFAGALSVDFDPHLALRTPFCQLPFEVGPEGRRALLPSVRLRASWLVGTTAALDTAASQFVAAAHGEMGVQPPVLLAPDTVAAAYREGAAMLRTGATWNGPPSVADLPLVEVAATTTRDLLAIIYSGDGGWRDIDKQVGGIMAAKGIAIVGVDCLHYFWTEKPPAQVGDDLARIITHYMAAWHIRHVILLGYSFGADILPFAYNELPAEIQGKINMISLLSPERAADFEIRILGWLGAAPGSGARPLQPETVRINPTKMQCIFGADDASISLCTDPTARTMEVIERPGGHHFDHNYQALAKIVLAGACGRGVACS